ncbi:MAG: hypothetical protein ACRCXT_13090 [Paraclostridium sp.]
MKVNVVDFINKELIKTIFFDEQSIPALKEGSTLNFNRNDMKMKTIIRKVNFNLEYNSFSSYAGINFIELEVEEITNEQ